MIKGLFQSGAMPTLERVVQFTEQRHKLLADNIANFDTPHYRPVDVDPVDFQKALGKAIDARRRTSTPTTGEMRFNSDRQIDFRPASMRLTPRESNHNILFHDRNNRDLERTMQSLAENQMTHQSAITFLKAEFDLLRTAIRERV